MANIFPFLIYSTLRAYDLFSFSSSVLHQRIVFCFAWMYHQLFVKDIIEMIPPASSTQTTWKKGYGPYTFFLGQRSEFSCIFIFGFSLLIASPTILGLGCFCSFVSFVRLH